MRIPSSLNSTDARSKPVQRLGHVRAGGGEHRQDRPEDLEADRAQPRLAAGDRDLRHLGEVAGEHQRAPRDLAADPRGLGHRVGHQPREGALAQAAGEQPPQEGGLGLGGARRAARRAAAGAAPPSRSRSSPRSPMIARSTSATVSDGSAAGARSTPWMVGVADADPALARHPGEKADADRHLARRPARRSSSARIATLRRARARGGDGLGGGDDVGEQGHAAKSSRSTPLLRACDGAHPACNGRLPQGAFTCPSPEAHSHSRRPSRCDRAPTEGHCVSTT